MIKVKTALIQQPLIIVHQSLNSVSSMTPGVISDNVFSLCINPTKQIKVRLFFSHTSQLSQKTVDTYHINTMITQTPVICQICFRMFLWVCPTSAEAGCRMRQVVSVTSDAVLSICPLQLRDSARKMKRTLQTSQFGHCAPGSGRYSFVTQIGQSEGFSFCKALVEAGKAGRW